MRDRWLIAVCAIALLAYWLAWLGSTPLFDVDEGAFAEATREMLASRDWLHTTLNGADRFDKPILVYWLQAAAMTLFGRTEFAVRLPSAMCAWVWCLSTGLFTARRWGRTAGVAAAAVLATSAGPLLIGRAATADGLLNMLLALAMFDVIRYVELSLQDADGRGAQVAMRRAAFWTGLGVLAKGPVAIVVPVGALFAWSLVARGRAWRVLARASMDVWAWVILIAVAVPWYAYALHRHGRAFIDGFLMRHNVERFTGTLENHGGSLGYYVVVLPLILLPWTPLLVPVARWLRRATPAHAVRPTTGLLLAWCGFVIVFFSLSGTKLPHYVLYGFTPLAILMGAWLASGQRSRAVPIVGAMSALGIAIGAVSPEFATWLGQRPKDVFWHVLTAASTLPPRPQLAWAAAALLVIAIATAWAVRRPGQAWIACIASACAMALWFEAQVVPWWGATLQGPVRDLTLEAAARGLPLVQWRVHQPSAGFYRDAPADRRAPAPGEAALVRMDRMDLPGDDRPPQLQVLQQERGMALVLNPAR